MVIESCVSSLAIVKKGSSHLSDLKEIGGFIFITFRTFLLTDFALPTLSLGRMK